MKITLYKHCFAHEDQMHMGISLMVWRSDWSVSAVPVSGYITSASEITSKAIDIYSLAYALKTMFKEMGQPVDMEGVLQGTGTIYEALKAEWGSDDLQDA